MAVYKSTVSFTGNDAAGRGAMETGYDVNKLTVVSIGAGTNVPFVLVNLHLLSCPGCSIDDPEPGVVESRAVVTEFRKRTFISEDEQIGGIFNLAGLLDEIGSFAGS